MTDAQMNGQNLEHVPLELDPMHLGDVNNTIHSGPPQKSSGLLKAAALIGLGTLIGPVAAHYAAPVIDKLFDDPTPAVAPVDPPEFEDTDTDTQYELDISVGGK